MMSPICAVADSLVQLLPSVAVADHETDRDFQVLLVGLLRQVEHLLGRDAVGHERLLHEDVEAAGRWRIGNATQRNASGVARITMSPGCKASMAFL